MMISSDLIELFPENKEDRIGELNESPGKIEVRHVGHEEGGGVVAVVHRLADQAVSAAPAAADSALDDPGAEQDLDWNGQSNKKAF